MKRTNHLWFFCLALTVLALPLKSMAQQGIPSPKSHFGFNIGDDYHLANFTQTEAYFKKLDAASDRLKLVDIGETEEGRRQYMFVVSSAENMKNIEHYRQISQKMARAEISEAEARKLSKEGKAVVWIDGGLHSTETVGMHQLIEMAYQLAIRTDEETMNILNNTVILLVHANPDGQELVSNWYMRENTPEKRSLSNLPTMYQKYIGHDNNRDFFMLNMKESQNIARQLFVDWVPQIMYNHHQTAPAGAVVAGAPYRDPHNYVFDPILMTSLDALGAAMHTRLNSEGKPGYTQRGGSVFSTWYNGGLRTTTYFHNIAGLLTEIIGGPNPFEIPLVPSRLLPNGDTPNPVLPQTWYFRQSIDYSVSLNYAILSYAARHRDEVLYNIYRMGRNSIEKGSRDTWSFSPKKIDAINKSYADAQAASRQQGASQSGAAQQQRFGGSRMPLKHLEDVINNVEYRDPRGYIIPAAQTDFPTAVKFLNALIRTGVEVQRATADFTVAGKSYRSGSYIVKTAQAFRPHVLDMFEPQDHPNDFQYAGGPPIPPYDAAGWTPAYLMNVKFDRFQDDFSGPFEKLPVGKLLSVPDSRIPNSRFLALSAKTNDSYKVANALINAGIKVGRDQQSGDFIIETNAKSKALLETQLAATGVQVQALSARPVHTVPVNASRVALWDTYGGSMPSGWVRWIGEQYGYNMQQIFAPEIDHGHLNDKYDVIVFVGGAIPGLSGGGFGGFGTGGNNQEVPASIPAIHHHRWGRITAEKSIPALREFLEKGGKIVTVGSSANLAYHLGLPVRDALVELVDGRERPLPNEKYYTPGSVLQAKIRLDNPANWGLEEYTDIYFARSPVFRLSPEAVADGTLKPLMWFDSETPLRSGWAWGQYYLKDGVAAFEAKVGKGSLYVFGPEITFRAQAQGTFKLLFNQLYK